MTTPRAETGRSQGAAMLAGAKLGAYEVIAKLGAGGMGAVYRARDTKLGRDVALKILPAAFASDPDRLMRFEREARTLASLNHPHIGAIHGLEEHNGTTALALEMARSKSSTSDSRNHSIKPQAPRPKPPVRSPTRRRLRRQR